MIGAILAGAYGNVAPTGDFESIATVTVGSGGAANIEFTSIPSTYQHLQIRGIVRNTGFDAGGARQNLQMQINSDTASNYSTHALIGNGASASAYNAVGSFIGLGGYGVIPMSDATSGIFGANIIDILDYQNTNKFKTIRFLGGVDSNDSTSEYANFSSGSWRNTNAITSITLYPNAGTFAQYSQYALYGIKG